MYGRVRFTCVASLALMLLTVGTTVCLAQGPGVAPEVQEKPASRPISLDVQEAEIGTVLRSLAAFSGSNIVAAPTVVGKVTVKLEQVPWVEALEVILDAHGFDYIEENGVFRIDTAEQLREEKLAVERSRKQVEDLAVLEMNLVHLSFAHAEEVKDTLEKMLTDRGTIEVDVRTNSLLINDINERVGMLSDMAARLDSPTPQVEINARIVDMDVRSSRELGINWGVGNFKSPGNNVVGSLSIDNALQSPAADMRVGTVQDWGELMVQIQAMENENKANLISNPIITTTNNREAKILVGQKIPLIVSDEAGNAITQLTTIGIMLQVTPHINSENRITLDIHNEVSDLSSQATVQGGVIINTSESDTRVLVENGETAIIGGLIRKVDSKLKNGIPILKDIPLLGALFRHSTDVEDHRELVVFVTPRIITQQYMQRGEMTTESDVSYHPVNESSVVNEDF